MRAKIVAWMLTCGMLVGASAQAGTLTSATWVGDFQGTPFTLLTSGASLTARGSANGSSIFSVEITVAAPRFTSTTFNLGAPVLFTQTLGGSQTIDSSNLASGGISGALQVFIVGTDPDTPLLLFPIGLSVGAAGNFTTTALVPGLNIPIEATATYFPWTTGSQTFTGLSGSTTTTRGRRNIGIPLPDVTIAGTNSLINGVGSITLVAPSIVRACVGPIFGRFPCESGRVGNTLSSRLATTTRLTLNFDVPEPSSTWLLVTASALGLGAARRCTKTRSSPLREET